MTDFDTIIRGGRIAALGADLGAAKEIVDATGKWVLPGGIDSHVHVSQPSGEGIVMADDFETGPSFHGRWSPRHSDVDHLSRTASLQSEG